MTKLIGLERPCRNTVPGIAGHLIQKILRASWRAGLLLYFFGRTTLVRPIHVSIENAVKELYGGPGWAPASRPLGAISTAMCGLFCGPVWRPTGRPCAKKRSATRSRGTSPERLGPVGGPIGIEACQAKASTARFTTRRHWHFGEWRATALRGGRADGARSRTQTGVWYGPRGCGRRGCRPRSNRQMGACPVN